jgi:hypothetical protein
VIDTLSAVLLLVAALLAVPVLVLAVQVAAALGFRPSPPGAAPGRPWVAVLVPAHDEAAVIAPTLKGIQAQLSAQDRLLVVADNCADATAEIARSLGAEVLERQDPVRRGKGYALDYGIRHLEVAPPEVVIVVDADCTLGDGTIDTLAWQCAASGQPVQALDLMEAPEGAGLRTRTAELAWLVKNLVRPLGFLRLGLPCQLMGTGMAFPWPLISRASLATGHVTEDLKLGLELARAGSPPLFCPQGLVTSRFPADGAAQQAQRARWEGGHLGLLAGEAPRLLVAAVRERNGPLLALALDLTVPPLALLCLLLPAVAGLAGLAYTLGGPLLPLAVALGAAGLLVFSLLAAWWRFGQAALPPGDLPAVLGYALGKLPLYLKFALGRQVEWIRTKRDGP